MTTAAFQDLYPDEFSYCYGCGRKNDQGHHLKSYWDGDETVARYTPEPFHTGGIPGNVYGGLIASLLDCHGTASAAAAAFKAEGREMGTEPPMRFVTAALSIEYLKPTPIEAELEVRATIEEVAARKVILALTLSAAGTVCATGRMVAVRLREGAP
ncbi:MAG: PaaI family thioesterase, partial [Dehalococcoidia bacterium]